MDSSSGDPNRKKRSSLNAKYDRIFGNTSAVRTGKASLELLDETNETSRLRAQEKQQQEQRDHEAMLKRKGVKMGNTGRVSRDLNGGGGVASNLQKYRMGNVPPPRGNTPPVTLDQKLRDIIFPPKPPPKVPTPPYQPLVPEHHSSIRRLSEAHHDNAYDPRYQPYLRPQYQYAPAPERSTSYAQGQAYSPHTPPTSFPPLAGPPVMGIGMPQVSGWIYTPTTDWVYIPPPPYISPGQIPYSHPLPPPPPSHVAQSYYASPYSEHGSIPESPHALPGPGSEDRQQPPLPKSILRNSSSSEASNGYPSSRTVTFRETPDFASPHVLEMAEYRRSDNSRAEEMEDETPYASPPKWKLRKSHPQSTYMPQADAEEESSPGTQHPRDQEEGKQASHYARHEPDRHGQNPRVSSIPSILASAHQQLLHGHGIVPEASGKRCGRALVQSLEDMAEAHPGLLPTMLNERDQTSWSAVQRTAEPFKRQTISRSRAQQDDDRARDHAEPYQPQPDARTIDRQPHTRAAKGRLPPPSQNWRESQQPQMAFSDAGSQSQSQLSGSQLSSRQYASQHQHERLSQQEREPSHSQLSRELSPTPPHPDHDYPEPQADRDYPEDPHRDQDFRPRLHDDEQEEYQDQQSCQDQEREQDQEDQHPRPSSLAPSSSASRNKIPKRRLTDLEVRYDNDPTDSSYRLALSPDLDADADELDYDVDADLDDLLNLDGNDDEPVGKRIKVTEGAWARYDIPRDKLPQVLQPRARPKIQEIRSRRWDGKEETQSQVSQIEQSDDGYDNDDRGLDQENDPGDDIEVSWSYGHSQQSGDGIKGGNGKLSTITEEEEEEEQRTVGIQIGNGDEVRGQKNWVEEGVFGDGGELGFKIWRDRY